MLVPVEVSGDPVDVEPYVVVGVVGTTPSGQSVRDAQGELGQGEQGHEEQDHDAQGHAVARPRAPDGGRQQRAAETVIPPDAAP